jgi:hypothetical protein
MAIPTKADAQTEASTDLQALETENNTLFLAEAEKVIQSAIDRGETQCYMTTGFYVNVKTVCDALVALGYMVTFPKDEMNTKQVTFTYAGISAFDLKSPARLCIVWK